MLDCSCPCEQCGHCVCDALHLAQHTLVHRVLLGQEVPVGVGMLCAFLAIEGRFVLSRITQMVKRDGYCHWQINQ